MLQNQPFVVFSNVDRIFDDPSPRSINSAASGLSTLRREHIPLVLCSSRTRAELEHLSQGLGICHPFICEGGNAVFIPKGYLGFNVRDARDVAGYKAVEFGHPYAAVVETLHRTAERLRILVRGFSDMSVEQVARECNLTLLQARLVKLREYGELFRVVDPDPSARNRLFKALNGARLLCVPGSLYDHVGAPVDYRVGVDLLCDLYRRARGEIVTLGLTDADSEGNGLQLVDVPVVIRPIGAARTSRAAREWSAAAVAEVNGMEQWVDTIIEIVFENRRQTKARAH